MAAYHNRADATKSLGILASMVAQKAWSVRLEETGFQGVLFSLIYRQCVDTIKVKGIIAP